MPMDIVLEVAISVERPDRSASFVFVRPKRNSVNHFSQLKLMVQRHFGMSQAYFWFE